MVVRDKLIVLLDKYVDEYKEIKTQYKIKRKVQIAYEDVIESLVSEHPETRKLEISMLLNEIYKDELYTNEFYRILSCCDKNDLIKKFIDKIKKDYYDLSEEVEVLKLRKERNEQLSLSAKRVSISMKYQTPISEYKNDVFDVKRIISYYEAAGVISSKEELLLINEIEMYNKRVESKIDNISERKEYSEFMYNEIPNILSIGFQEHDVIDVSEEKKQILDRFVSEIMNTMEYTELDGIEELFESYKVYNLEEYEYNYIIVTILDNYLDELMILYELLIDKEVYRYKENRMEVVKNYYQTLEKYLIVREYYNKIREYAQEDIRNHELIDEPNKVLIYSHSDVNVNKIKLITDMSNIPNEYYDTVYDLISRFKTGDLQPSEFKYLRNHKGFSGLFELRYDQVRIVLKHARDNIYGVLGVFAKKADNDMLMYGLMANRRVPDISNDKLLAYQLELAKNTEENLEKIVHQKGRKGTR